MKKIAIIDDNKAVRSSIKNIIEHNFKNSFEFVEANSVLSGHKLITETNPDIVLLDIEMGDGTGLDLVHLFSEIHFKLVFITAHKDYAIKAIKHRPEDYLLKPVNPFDLIKVINTLQNELNTSTSPISNNINKIVIKNQDTSILLDVNSIIRCEADGAYTKIITSETEYMASKNLKHFTDLLEDKNFLRVHNAHLVNANCIKMLNRHTQTGITMENGDKVPVSSRKIKVISKFLEALS
ncbi:response regulator transcription factor [Hyunsoonleella flava]|uniref:Response regulator transcription factor n=1 Tax=Hyunsoonleella flava TaxID=2527939 RepID=A0A4Q9FLR0_9FLAO|nr:LytTR family DNA-binding domain-containing protein [Hyunsoonleella flava]TBN06717.1 response regulator transcription factor [Hyunsoonleella flava]